MPRNYSRKSNRQGWDKISMEKAIQAVKNNEMGWLLASKVFNIPQSTLRRHALEQNQVLAPTKKGMGRYKSVFTYEMERELVEHIKLLETRLFGFTRKEVLELAYQFADVNNIPHNFNNEKKMAGKEWLAGFRRRHKGIESLSFAKEHGIIMVCLPPHCTHRMQPLDVSFYGPLKTYFNQEVSTWLKSHPGRVVTHFQIGGILNKAYGKAATVRTAVHGFQKTGLWPVDPNIFPDYLFEPAESTNIPIRQDLAEPEEDSTVADNRCLSSAGPSQIEAGNSTSLIIASTSAATNPCPVSAAESTDSVTAGPMIPTSSKILQDVNINVPVSVLSPVPQGIYVTGQGKRKLRKKPTVLLLISTPNIEETKSKPAPPPPPEKKTRKVTKVLDFSSDSENDFSSLYSNTVAKDDDEDCPCIYCNSLYSRSKPKEVWLQCLSCKRWAHALCADVPKKTKRFACELCM